MTEYVSRRVVVVVLVVVFITFSCMSFTVNLSPVDGLQLLQQIASEPTVSRSTFDHTVAVYRKQHENLIFLRVGGSDIYPTIEFQQQYNVCCRTRNGHSIHVSDFRTEGTAVELHKYVLGNDTSAFFDVRKSVRRESVLAVYLMLSLVSTLILAAYIFSRDSKMVVIQPVQVNFVQQGTSSIIFFQSGDCGSSADH